MQAPEQFNNLRADRNVERGHRLIGYDKFRTQCECARDTDALALSAGKFMRETPQCLAIQPDRFKRRGNFRASFGTTQALLMDFERFAHDDPDTVFASRIFVGSARYPNQQVMLDALAAAGPAMVTMSIRRIIMMASIAVSPQRDPHPSVRQSKARGTICNEKPHRSLHQMHALSLRPFSTIAFQ